MRREPGRPWPMTWGASPCSCCGGRARPWTCLWTAASCCPARVNDSGYLAVTAQQSGYKGAVTLYNAGGEKVIQINLSSTFLVDAAPSPDGRMVAAVAMDSDGGSFRSRVLFYQVNQKEPSLEVSLGGSSVLDMRYTDSGLWVLGESSLMIVSPKDGACRPIPLGAPT